MSVLNTAVNDGDNCAHSEHAFIMSLLDTSHVVDVIVVCNGVILKCLGNDRV